MFDLSPHTLQRRLLFVLIFLTLLIGGLAVNRQNQLEDTITQLKARYASTTQTLQAENQKLAGRLQSAQKRVSNLRDSLEDERERNDELEQRVEDVTDSLDKVQKTVQTEPELLKKYSRTFFLSENYKPESLAQIDQEYLDSDDESLTVDKRVWPYLEDLLEAAHDDGIQLLVTSAYRPFGEQAELNQQYLQTYGTGANQFSAAQGYSEHQLGTTIDFTTPTLKGLSAEFADTKAYKWLQSNAHEYGFILSYPPGNQYYQFEPWHWRFVGKELASDLRQADASLYEWSQRKIDSYRSEMFGN